MTRVAGPSLDQLDRLGDDYADLVARSLATAARQLHVNHAAVEDLGAIRTDWAISVETVLLPALGVAFEVGAAQVRVGLREAVGLTAAAFTDVAPTSDALSEQYLAQARNRLVGVGDELWAHAREGLLEGLQAGESVPELAVRVRKAAPDLTEPRAVQIARTEVLGAVNAGALEQVLASGATGTKEWMCVTADTPVWLSDVTHAVARLADEDLVTLRTRATGGSSGASPEDGSLTVTPNHPVLTTRGWVPAELVKKGDHLIRCTLRERGAAGDPDVENAPLTARQVFDAACDVSPVQRVVRTGLDLDGEPTYSYVDVVPVTGDLLARCQPPLSQPSDEALFALSDVGLDERLSGSGSVDVGLSEGDAAQLGGSLQASETLGLGGYGLLSLGVGTVPTRSAALVENAHNRRASAAVALGEDRHAVAVEVIGDDLRDREVVSADSSDAELLSDPSLGDGRRPFVAPSRGFGPGQQLASFAEPTPEGLGADVDGGADLLGSLPGPVAADEVVDVQREFVHGAIVYDFSTVNHWFLAADYIVHNSTDDERTRHAHDKADDQVVPLREHFTVGGFPMLRPHDPAGPPHLTVNCRCSLAFDLDLDSVTMIEAPEPIVDIPVPPLGKIHQRDDRQFLARVFSDGLAALVGWFKARTAAAMIPEQTFEQGADMTAVAAEPTVAAQQGAWEGVLVVEGTPTGDGRQFASGALTWAELPLPLKWQEAEAEGHSGAVIAGRIDTIEREGNQLVGRGVFDLEGANGREAHRLVDGRGVSIMPDDISDEDVEVEFSEGQEDNPLAKPKLVTYTAGRVRSATLCAEAAFVEAEVRLTGLAPAVAAGGAGGGDGWFTLDDYRPPAAWFTDPALPEPTGIVVEEDGRVYGHAALSTSCHIGFADQCVSPPHEADHPYFLTGEVVTADGSRVPVGQVTLATGHAPLSYGAQKAAAHYDDTGSVVADVTCGNDEHGIWVAGAVRPGTDPARVHELRASGQLSGDWRRIGGQLRLVALLAVNVPGFPVPRPRARVASGSAQALVAAGKVDHDAGQGRPDLTAVKQRVARTIGRDPKSRKAAVAARVKARR